jgi:hypothetical protein
MSLSEKLKTATRSEPGLPCGVSRLLATVNDEDREALEVIFSTKAGNGSVSNLKIHEIISSEGHNIAFASVRLHRSKACRCFIGKTNQLKKHLNDKLEKNND